MEADREMQVPVDRTDRAEDGWGGARDIRLRRTVDSRICKLNGAVKRFLSLRCATDLIERKLVRDEWDMTLAMVAWENVRKMTSMSTQSGHVTCYVLEAGCRPSVAAIVAFMTKWSVISIGPRLQMRYQNMDDTWRLVAARCQVTQFWGVSPGAIMVDARVARDTHEMESMKIFCDHNPDAVEKYYLTSPTGASVRIRKFEDLTPV